MSDRRTLLNAALRWFLLGMILANISSEMAYFLLPVYLRELGATVAQVGLVFSAMSLSLLLLQLIGGLLSDALGRLRAIALGSVAATTGYLLLPLSPSWTWVMLALCLEALSGALVGPSFAPFIAEQSTEENRGRVFGLAYSVFMVVGVIGPALGGSLASRLGFRAMLWVSFVLYACAAGLRVWMTRSARFGGTQPAQRPTVRTLQDQVRQMTQLWVAGGLLPWIGITFALRDSALQLSGQMQPLYLAQVAGLSVAEIGWLGSAAGMAKMVGTYVAGGFADRRGEQLAIVGGLLLEATGLFMFVLVHSQWAFAGAMAALAAGGGVLMTAQSSLISKAVPEKSRGLASATLQTSSGLLQLPAPWVGGQVWEHLNPRAPFAISALAIAICALPARLKLKRVGGTKS
jgi:MFS family permease